MSDWISGYRAALADIARLMLSRDPAELPRLLDDLEGDALVLEPIISEAAQPHPAPPTCGRARGHAMNARDNRFYRAAADRAAIDAVLAEAIYDELVADHTAAAVLDLWQHRHIGASDLADMRAVLATVAANAIDTVLARRQSLAARTGPWDGGHHCQEEDGYPGSLLPPKRGET